MWGPGVPNTREYGESVTHGHSVKEFIIFIIDVFTEVIDHQFPISIQSNTIIPYVLFHIVDNFKLIRLQIGN